LSPQVNKHIDHTRCLVFRVNMTLLKKPDDTRKTISDMSWNVNIISYEYTQKHIYLKSVVFGLLE